MITRVFHTRVPMSQWDVGGGHRLGGRLRASINASTPFNPKLRHPLTAEIVD